MVMKSSDTAVAETLDQIKAATAETEQQEGPMPEDQTQVEETETASVEFATDLTAELAKANERIAALEAELAAAAVSEPVVEADPEAVTDDLLKSVPEPVRKMLEEQSVAIAKAQAEAAAATEALRKARDEAADKEAIAKVAGWTSLTLDSAEVGPALRRLADVDGELAKALEAVLESVNAQAESAGIFAEIGKSATADSGDAYGTLSTLAKAKVEAGQASTFEQAFASVVTDHPDLYTQHLNEKGF